MTINKLIVSMMIAGALSVGPTLYAQKEDPQQNKQQADRPSEETITGCLTEQQGSYMLATTAGEQINVSGSADLSKHKDHTVKLTGAKSDAGGKMTLKVSKIEHVSPSCSK